MKHIKVICLIILFGASAWAVADRDEQSRVDDEISEIARERAYPGGVDEEDLVIQKPLPVITRRLSATGEAEHAEAELSED